MKLWKLLLLLLAVKPAAIRACSYYPRGEAVRFHLLESSAFGYRDMTQNSFASDLYAPGQDEHRRYDGNILQWAAYCRHRVPASAIEKAVYELDYFTVKNRSGGNDMIRYLLRHGDTAALNYLAFAKSCEQYDNYVRDPWERSEITDSTHNLNIRLAQRFAAEATNPELRSRYAFLAIRLSYYIRQGEGVEPIWAKYFAGRKLTSTIDQWALFFRALSDTNPARQNYYLAQVFIHSPDKRERCFQHFNWTSPMDSANRYATSGLERSAIHNIYALHNPGRALPQIEHVSRELPRSEFLDFLLLREITKLEDWIYTPTYAHFNPSMQTERGEETPARLAMRNVESDREYAARLLKFVRSKNVRARANPVIWQTADAYLRAMTGRYPEALASLHKAERMPGNDAQTRRQHGMLRSIWTIASMPKGKAKIPEFSKGILMDEKRREKNAFLFAVGRELEAKGAATSAAFLYSHTNDLKDDWNQDVIYWRSKRGHANWYDDYYDEYFGYLDAAYTAEQLGALLEDVAGIAGADSFGRWLRTNVTADDARLRDLLGTKYIRRNDLASALRVFRTVPDSLYTSDRFGYKSYLAANPFYTNLYNEHQATNADSLQLTKAQITERLIAHLRAAADPRAPYRSMHYFQAATCYLNMTQYGNSWMMRRFYWTATGRKSGLEDDAEYFRAGLAQHYYLRAEATAKDRRFAALSLRMAGRCEKYRLMDVLAVRSRHWAHHPEPDVLYRKNRFWEQLRRQYPDDADELLSNCSSFDRYYAGGR